MVLVFDGDCSFCSSSARLFQKLTKGRVDIEPYQFANLEVLGLRAEDCERAVQFVSEGQRFEGHLAIAQALKASKTGWAIAGYLLTLPVITSAAFVVYAWVSNNRHKLPGGTPACAVNK
ncbi:DUF393 domain-containing protein [Aquiluna borgnonia]|uniref:DUF393 domain-containing protein n=1 Tax=Aquiluna borgnonia TaxID=2499157 RepID=A0A7D4QC14_9MICO|nr:DUF393 domain-containing protein [Aquiluna borgnonia]QKJ25610.1 DUF393 domain-containing protein [Aquiluna borgnonia]